MAKSKTSPAAKAPAKKAAAPAAKKPNGKKPAAAKKAATADRSAAISASWQDPKVYAARIERTAVKVGADTYKSVPAAFDALKLPLGRMVRFRQALKAAGKAVFETDAGDKIKFSVVAA